MFQTTVDGEPNCTDTATPLTMVVMGEGLDVDGKFAMVTNGSGVVSFGQLRDTPPLPRVSKPASVGEGQALRCVTVQVGGTEIVAFR
jgi:hypothetical protein